MPLPRSELFAGRAVDPPHRSQSSLDNCFTFNLVLGTSGGNVCSQFKDFCPPLSRGDAANPALRAALISDILVECALF